MLFSYVIVSNWMKYIDYLGAQSLLKFFDILRFAAVLEHVTLDVAQDAR